MKSLAHQCIRWPGMNQDIENMVKNCEVCQEACHKHPDWPQKPWQRVHADHVRLFLGKRFLLLVHTNTKWVDIHMVNSSSASEKESNLCNLGITTNLSHRQWSTFYIWNLPRKWNHTCDIFAISPNQ